MNTKRLLIVAFALAVIGLVAITSATLLVDHQTDGHGDISWQTDLAAAQETAQAEDRPVLLYFWSENCGGCEAFNERIADDPSLRDTLESFERVSVDSGRSGSRDLFERYNVSVTPTLVVTTPDGEHVRTVQPASSSDTESALRSAAEDETMTDP